MPARERAVTVPGHRRLGLAEFGPQPEPGVLPIIYLHGFVGSRLEVGAAGPILTRIIGFDRPGYGWTSPQRHPSIRVFGEDLAAGLDCLGIQRCILVGASSGAAYALAAAKVLGRRVAQLVIIGGVGPPEVLQRAGGKARALVQLGKARGGTAIVRHQSLRLMRILGLDRGIVGLALANELRAFQRLGLATDVLQERLLYSLRTGCGLGMRGALADARLLASDWDFDPRSVDAPSLILHGEDDDVVPLAHGQWFASTLRGAQFRVLPGAMHLSSCFESAHLVQAQAIRGG